MKIPPTGCGGKPVSASPDPDSEQNSPAKMFVCTLAPLIDDGRHCLVCHDIDGLKSVALERLEFYFAGCPWQRIVRQSDDLFSLVEQGMIRWPALEHISVAQFRLRLKNDRRTYRILVRPPARSVRGGPEVMRVTDEWLQKRKFMEVPADECNSLDRP